MVGISVDNTTVKYVPKIRGQGKSCVLMVRTLNSSGWCSAIVWVSSCKPKVHRFGPQSGPVQRWPINVSLSLPLSLKIKNKNIFFKKGYSLPVTNILNTQQEILLCSCVECQCICLQNTCNLPELNSARDVCQCSFILLNNIISEHLAAQLIQMQFQLSLKHLAQNLQANFSEVTFLQQYIFSSKNVTLFSTYIFFMSFTVVGRLIAPKDGYTLTPRTCEYVTLKRNFTEWLELRTL